MKEQLVHGKTGNFHTGTGRRHQNWKELKTSDFGGIYRTGEGEGKSEGLAEGEAKGLAKGNDLGMFNITLQFVNDGDISIEKACEKLHMSLDEFYRKKAEFENKE